MVAWFETIKATGQAPAGWKSTFCVVSTGIRAGGQPKKILPSESEARGRTYGSGKNSPSNMVDGLRVKKHYTGLHDTHSSTYTLYCTMSRDGISNKRRTKARKRDGRTEKRKMLVEKKTESKSRKKRQRMKECGSDRYVCRGSPAVLVNLCDARGT